MSVPHEAPGFVTRVLHACCPPERLEEIEGDLLELFTTRCERFGASYARKRYALEVCGIGLRQLGLRTHRNLGRAARSVVVYPLRILSLLLVLMVALIPASSTHAWARGLLLLVGCAYAVVDALVYVTAAWNMLKLIGEGLQRRRRPRD